MSARSSSTDSPTFKLEEMLRSGGGGGFNPKKPKKPKISLKSHFGCWVFLGFLGFNWIFLRTFKKNVMKVFLPTVMLLSWILKDILALLKFALADFLTKIKIPNVKNILSVRTR